MEDEKARSEATFRFTIRNFRNLKDPVMSHPCYVRNLPWKIMATPRQGPAPDRKNQKYLGFYLHCNDKNESSNWSCFATAELRLISHKPDSPTLERKIQHLFYSKEDDWGFAHFMPWNDVLDPKKGFIKDGAITLEVRMTADQPHGVCWDASEINTEKRDVVKRRMAKRRTAKEIVVERKTGKENVAERVAVKKETANSESAKENVSERETAKENLASRDAIKKETANSESEKENVAQTDGVKRDTANSELAKENVSERETAKENLALRDAVKRQTAISESEKENVADTDGVKRETANSELAKENVAEKERAKENLILHAVKRELAERVAAKENLALKDVVKRELPNSKWAKENVAETNAAERETAKEIAAEKDALEREACDKELRILCITSELDDVAEKALQVKEDLANNVKKLVQQLKEAINEAEEARTAARKAEQRVKVLEAEALQHQEELAAAERARRHAETEREDLLDELTNTNSKIRRRPKPNADPHHITVNVVLEESFLVHQGSVLFDPARGKSTTFKFKKDATVRVLMGSLSVEFARPLDQIRPWPFRNRNNQTCRPTFLDVQNDLQRTVADLAQGSNPWNIYLEMLPPNSGLNSLPPFDTDCHVMIFFKYYDNELKRIEYCGHKYVPTASKLVELIPILNGLAGLPPGTPLTLYEEIKPNVVEKICNHGAQINEVLDEMMDSNIIVFERSDLELPTCQDYFKHIFHKVEIQFVDKTLPNDPGFTMELSMQMRYDQMAKVVGQHLNVDPNLIQFFKCRNNTGSPGLPVCNGKLKNLFVSCNTNCTKKIFYQILLQFKCLWVGPNHNDKELILYPNKGGKVKDLLVKAAKNFGHSADSSIRLQLVEVSSNKVLPVDLPLAELKLCSPCLYRVEEIPRQPDLQTVITSLELKVAKWVANLEEQLEAESRERLTQQKNNRKMDKKMKELALQLDEERRHADQYKDHIEKMNNRLKALKKQVDEAEEEMHREKIDKRKAQRELEDILETHEALTRECNTLRNKLRLTEGSSSSRVKSASVSPADSDDSNDAANYYDYFNTDVTLTFE